MSHAHGTVLTSTSCIYFFISPHFLKSSLQSPLTYIRPLKVYVTLPLKLSTINLHSHHCFWLSMLANIFLASVSPFIITKSRCLSCKFLLAYLCSSSSTQKVACMFIWSSLIIIKHICLSNALLTTSLPPILQVLFWRHKCSLHDKNFINNIHFVGGRLIT